MITLSGFHCIRLMSTTMEWSNVIKLIGFYSTAMDYQKLRDVIYGRPQSTLLPSCILYSHPASHAYFHIVLKSQFFSFPIFFKKWAFVCYDKSKDFESKNNHKIYSETIKNYF